MIARTEAERTALSNMVGAALEVGRERRQILDQLKQALLDNDTDEIVKFAKQICGLEHENKRTD
jgi:hypothetical protein